MGDIDYTYFDQIEEKWGPIFQNFSQKAQVNAFKLALISDKKDFNNVLNNLDRAIINEYKKAKVLFKYKYKSKSKFKSKSKSKSKSKDSKNSKDSKSRHFKVDFDNYLGYMTFIRLLEMNLEQINNKPKNENTNIDLMLAKSDFEKGLKLILESLV